MLLYTHTHLGCSPINKKRLKSIDFPINKSRNGEKSTKYTCSLAHNAHVVLIFRFSGRKIILWCSHSRNNGKSTRAPAVLTSEKRNLFLNSSSALTWKRIKLTTLDTHTHTKKHYTCERGMPLWNLLFILLLSFVFALQLSFNFRACGNILTKHRQQQQ